MPITLPEQVQENGSIFPFLSFNPDIPHHYPHTPDMDFTPKDPLQLILRSPAGGHSHLWILRPFTAWTSSHLSMSPKHEPGALLSPVSPSRTPFLSSQHFQSSVIYVIKWKPAAYIDYQFTSVNSV